MRGSKAKGLRKEAQNSTVGNQNVAYQLGHAPVFLNKDNTGGFVKVRPGKPTTLVEGCTRQVYKQLKKAV